MLCRGCDADLEGRAAYWAHTRGPYCRRCFEEVEAMQEPGPRTPLWRWLLGKIFG